MKATHNQFIGIYEDALNPGLCDALLNEFERHSALGVTNKGMTGQGVDTFRKRSEDLNIMAFPSLFDVNKSVIDSIMAMYALYSETYVGVKDYTAPHKVTALNIQKYKYEEKAAYYQFHCEIHPKYSDRVTTFVVYLNDIAEGGETEFLEQRIRVRPKKGTIVIFPAYFTHVHRGNPVLSNEDKYVISGWLNFVS